MSTCPICMYPVQATDAISYRGAHVHRDCATRDRMWMDRAIAADDESRTLRAIRGFAVRSKLRSFRVIDKSTRLSDAERGWLLGHAAAMHEVACKCETHIDTAMRPAERRIYADGRDVWACSREEDA